MKRLTVYGLVAVFALVVVFASAIDSYYQNQPNPSQPGTEISVQINDETVSLQEAIDEKMIGGEAGTSCGDDNQGVVSYDANSQPTCVVIR
jgi:hypothetical protein